MRRSSRTPWLLAAILGGIAILFPASPASAQPGQEVSIKASKGHIDFLAGNGLVARYHIDSKVAKPYFWPVNAPGGMAVTRGWPMEKAEPNDLTDHVHQKSLWFCHGDVIPEGIEVKDKIRGVTGVDFWSENKGHGKIVCTKVDEPVQKSKGHALVTTYNEWQTADGTKILDETRTIHLISQGGASLLVLEIDLNASVCPITFGDTKEGSMGARVRSSLTEKVGKGKITNAEGKVSERGCWGLVSGWCDYSGPLGEATAGIAIMADPSNPSPSCWHVRGYGLMAANPFGRNHAGFPSVKGKTELVKLNKGEHLKLRYGVLLHTGDATEGKVAEHYKEFVKLKS